MARLMPSLQGRPRRLQQRLQVGISEASSCLRSGPVRLRTRPRRLWRLQGVRGDYGCLWSEGCSCR